MTRLRRTVARAIFAASLISTASFAFLARAIDVSQNWAPASPVPNAAGSEPWMRLLADGRALLTYTDGKTSKGDYMVLPKDGDSWKGPFYIRPYTTDTWRAPWGQMLPLVENGGDIAQLISDGRVIRASAVFFKAPGTDVLTSDLYTNVIPPSQLENCTPSSYNTSWTADQPVLPQMFGNDGTRRNGPAIINLGPSALNRGKDHLLMVFIHGIVQGQLPTGIYMVQSNDSGQTWSRQRTVYDSPLYDSKPGLVKLDNGDVLCAFYSTSEPPAGMDGKRHPWRYVNGRVYVMRSSDGGATWEKAVIAAQEASRWDFAPALLQLRDGEIWLAFTSMEPSHGPTVSQVTKLVRSSDRGVTWGHMEIVPSSHNNDRWPALVQREDGTVLVVWSAKDPMGEGSESIWQSKTRSPHISITHPTILSKVKGTVTIQIKAAGATRVEYYVDSSSSPFAVSGVPPFTVAWDSAQLPEGTHTIQAVAYDSTGKKGDGMISVIIGEDKKGGESNGN